MRKILSIFLICYGITLSLLAQQPAKVQGTIADEDRQPLPGVTLRVKGAAASTVTDEKGHFSITAPPNGTLQISYVGFVAKDVKLNGQASVTILLEKNNSTMEETVVIGYQKITRRKNTAAISSISGREIQNLPSASFDQLLQGRLSGVNVQNFTGEPGAAPTVSVRGNSQVSGNYDQFNVINSPLYVVDGVPQPEQDYAGPATGTGTNYLAGINPNDIESVDVLKDASAAAIYGSRGANGVILITTKKGRSGLARVNISGYTGITERPQLREVTLGAEERRQKMAILQRQLKYAGQEQLPFLLTDSLNPAFNGHTNWQDMFYQTGIIKNLDLSMSGGSENMNYRFSSGYYDEEGIIKATGFTRYSTRLNLMTKALGGKLEVNPIISYARSSRERGNGDANNPINVSAGSMPSSLFNLDEARKASLLGTYNKNLDQNVGNQFNFNLNLGYNFSKQFKLTSQTSYLYKTSRRDYNRPNELTGTGNYSYTYSDNEINFLTSNYLSYVNNFGPHNVSIIAGQDIQYDQFQNTQAIGSGGASDQIQVIQGFRQASLFAYSDYQAYGLLSYYARMAYDYDGKYLFSISTRSDGSSRFGANNKWGFFPAASVAWIVSDESFMRNYKNISMLKLRASLGTSGSLPKYNYLQYNLYSVNNGGFDGNGGASSYNGTTAITPNFYDGAAQKNISWQKSMQWNIGTDVEFKGGKIAASLDFYNKENTLTLFSVRLPATSGYDLALTNAIGVRNSGVELTLAAYPLSHGSAIKWNTRLNIAYNKNRIMDLPNGGRDLVMSGDRFDKSHILSVGKPINAFYLYKTLGVYATDDDVPGNKYTGEKFRNGNHTYQAGDFIFADLDGDYFIDVFNDGLNPDKLPVGDPNPKVTGGFTNNFTWKNLTLGIFCTFTFDRDVLNLYKSDQFSNSTAGNAPYAFAQFATPDFTKLNIWTKPGDKATYAKYDIGSYGYYYTSAQTFFLEKGGYFRIKSVNLSYEIPAAKLKKWKMDRLRFFAIVDNLAVFQQSKELPDAEAVNPYGEYSGGGYPIPKKFTLGFDINF